MFPAQADTRAQIHQISVTAQAESSTELPHQVARVLHPVQHKETLQGPGGGDTLRKLHSPWQRHNSNCMHTCIKLGRG